MSPNGSGDTLAYGALHALSASLNPAQARYNQHCCVWRLLGNLHEMSWPSQIRSYSKDVHQNVTTADGSNLPFCQRYQQVSQRLNEHCTYMSFHLAEVSLPSQEIEWTCRALPWRRTFGIPQPAISSSFELVLQHPLQALPPCRFNLLDGSAFTTCINVPHMVVGP